MKQKRLKARELWPSLKAWKKYGLEQGYNDRPSSTLFESTAREERSWYATGQRNKWIPKFKFKPRSPWENRSEWEQYGINHDYNTRSSTSLVKSKKREERAWYDKGNKEGRLEEFELGRKVIRVPWQDVDSWKKAGFERGYNKVSPAKIKNSEDKEARSWYQCGERKEWTSKFEFKRERHIGRWKTLDEWKNYGLTNGYSSQRLSDIEENEDKEARSWYQKGRREGWLPSFRFTRTRNRIINTNNQFMDLVKNNPATQGLAVIAAQVDGLAPEVEKIFAELYPGRFNDLEQLHKLIKDNQEKIERLIKRGPTDLSDYIGQVLVEDRPIIPLAIGKAIELMGGEVPISVENRLYSVLKEVYAPRFNRDAFATIGALEGVMAETKGITRRVYTRMRDHYSSVLELEEVVS